GSWRGPAFPQPHQRPRFVYAPAPNRRRAEHDVCEGARGALPQAVLPRGLDRLPGPRLPRPLNTKDAGDRQVSQREDFEPGPADPPGLHQCLVEVPLALLQSTCPDRGYPDLGQGHPNQVAFIEPRPPRRRAIRLTPPLFYSF